MTNFFFVMFAILGFSITGTVAIMWLARLYGEAQKEAAAKDKRVEFAGFVVGLLGVVLATVSLIYSIVQVDSLQDRVFKLELAVETGKR